MRSGLRICSCLLLWSCSLLPAWAGCDWPEWGEFKHDYISEEGRVIDPADGRRITTSEGQSYGLFFALVNDDRETFDRLLQWTEVQLARGDLTGFLPAWQWGVRSDGSLGVLDDNSAADSDLWIAYSLLEAGRLWQNHSYQSIGTMLLRRIAREEVARLPGFGPVLLPAPRGFTGEGRWTINPSYLPPQLLARFASMQGPWQEMHALLPALLTATAPHGFAPDWIDWQLGSGWQETESKGRVGSYDAIRVYLWLGMLSEEDPTRAALVRHFAPMLAALDERGVPEKVDFLTGQVLSLGEHGFAAALLPLAKGQSVAEQLLRKPIIMGDGYYASVLALFGHGWESGRFSFGANGALLPRWSDECQRAD